MGLGFRITHEDVLSVLELHGVAEVVEDVLVEDAYATVIEMEDRITEAVLEHGGTGMERLAACREIEAILIEDGLLFEPAKVVVL